MRPIERGPEPVHPDDRPFKNYQEAKSHLENRLGEYCSYCERTSLAVEHIQPKSLHPELLLEWENFLLACSSCNSAKGSKDVRAEEYLWPHKNNTFRAFLYKENGVIEIRPELNEKQKRLAKNTLDLVGLRKQFRDKNNLRVRDKRWIKREKIWEKASDALKTLNKLDNEAVRRLIVQNSLSDGYWSVWMEVFKDDADMCRRLIDAFPGTCTECFDDKGKPVPRTEDPKDR